MEQENHNNPPGINMEGHGDFNNRLVSRLSRAPADLMHFLEACAMGNIDRVESLLGKGVVSVGWCEGWVEMI